MSAATASAPAASTAAPPASGPPAASPAAPAAAGGGAVDAARAKELALQEKLDKRATVVVGVLRKFIIAFYAGRQQMLDEARAAEAAKKAAKGKKGKGKKKGKEDKEKGGGKDAKPKKPPPNPVQQAWITFLADMDERISKQKRIFLEDMYRGVAMLDAREQSLLDAAIATTTTKVLPADGMNINQLNIKEAVAAGCSAARLARASALPPSGNPGLAALRDRGASVLQLLEFGFKERDALRAGFPAHAVVAASQHELHKLREAGLTPSELMSCPDAPQLADELASGPRGAQKLKEAGYALQDIVQGGVDNPLALARAGFTMRELHRAGFTAPGVLRSAGFGDPDKQDPGLMLQGMRTMARSVDVGALPHLLGGSQDPTYQHLIHAALPLQQDATWAANPAVGAATTGNRSGTAGATRAGGVVAAARASPTPA